jgi:hypothetical protein
MTQLAVEYLFFRLKPQMFYRIYKNVLNKVKSLIYFIEEKKTQYVNKVITQNFTQLGSIKIGFQINNIGTSSID